MNLSEQYNINPCNFEDCYDLMTGDDAYLGSGQFSVVSKCVRKDDGNVFASASDSDFWRSFLPEREALVFAVKHTAHSS